MKKQNFITLILIGIIFIFQLMHRHNLPIIMREDYLLLMSMDLFVHNTVGFTGVLL